MLIFEECLVAEVESRAKDEFLWDRGDDITEIIN